MTDEKLEEILLAIDKALDDGATPVAAFDADGTLWNTDVGQNFFEYQIQNKLVPLPDKAWDHYEKMQDINPREAYLWLAQVNKGKSLEEVHRWARESLERFGPTPLFDHQQTIINHLLSKDVEVYIVTASIKWAVDPASALYAIPTENVVGVTTKISAGLITDLQGGPVTYREGKVEGLLEATGGQKPFFCSGNSTGDLHLLEAASHIAFVNSAAREDEETYESEMELLGLAKERGWFSYRT